jgi:hypothetical protein
MSLAHQFLGDVAAVYIGGQKAGAFGSGRLIAPGLILTAGHVVDYPSREHPSREGWSVVLLRDKNPDGSWASPFSATLVWRGAGELDLALLRITENPPSPVFSPIFASYSLVAPLGETSSAGFPEAWKTKADSTRDYSVHGVLRIASKFGPYGWNVPPAYNPDKPNDWKGMSGAAVCRVGTDDKLYLFGAVQQVPANFSHGLLEVARLSNAFNDAEFRAHLRDAMGVAPSIVPFQLGPSRTDLGIARIFRTRTRAFSDEYLVSETGPVPFGGRDTELRRLDDWLLDPNTSPRMVVTAPAGRGKSALLVRWMKALQEGGVCGQNGWQLAFMPVSIRVGSNRPEVFYEGLARRLAEITGEELPSDAIRDADGFRYAVRDILDRIAISDRRVIVVLDGLDEALQGSFDPSILPTVLPWNVRVLLSARWQVGDNDSRGWLVRLGWDCGVRVACLELDRLKADAIADVLVKLGAPVDIIPREPSLVARLAQLPEGEALLVKYYAEDLWGLAGKGASITRADLDNMKPGFDRYFKRWFERQDELWQEEGIDPAKVDEVLQILAFALGPLVQVDISALMKRIHHAKGLIAPDRLLRPLRRFVFGDGKRNSGYVLSHPKIGDYLQNERFAALADELRRGFAAWGQAHLDDLNAGQISAEKASSYVLQFLPQHLTDVGATADDFMKMVEDGWRRAWEQFEGGERGFAATVQAASDALRRDGQNLRLGARWRCALTLSSLKSLGQNVPSELALAAAKRGVITPRQAAHFAELKGPCEEGVTLLAGLAVVVRDNKAFSEELALSALAAAHFGRPDRCSRLAGL